MLTINEYQKEAHKTACYLGLENGDYRYPVMGLAEESGEVCGKFAKAVRDNNGIIDEERKQAYRKARQEEYERKQTRVCLIINPNCVITDNESGKCYKVATGNKIQSPFKHRTCLIPEYIYLPKSQVNLIIRPNNRIFEIPTWLFESNASSYYRIGTLKKD